MKTFKRREFIKTGLVAGGAMVISRQITASGFFMSKPGPYLPPVPGTFPDIVTISGSDPETAVPRLIEVLGGMESFVKSGQTVGLLVNSPWKLPGYYTQPDPVIVLADLCFKAGAKEIICFKQAQPTYWERGNLYSEYKEVIDRIKYGGDKVETVIPKGIKLKKAELCREFAQVDVFISFPVAKHHAGTIFSGNLKGMMGVSSSYTNRYMHSPEGDYTYDNHEYLAQCIADLNTMRKPDLCIMDAIECGLNNGPAGPGETFKPGKLIGGRDPLALDVYASTLIGFNTDDILTFRRANEHGLGQIDPGKLSLMEL